jgi:hypothetical protein
MARYCVGDLATHVLHGRVVEIQRMRRARVAQRPFAFPFAFEPADLPFPFFAAAGRAGFADRAATFAGFADFTIAFTGAAAFAALAVLTTGAAAIGAAAFAGGAAAFAGGAAAFAGGATGLAGKAAGGRAGARELVLSGGRGCFRGRPLFRAA